MTPIYKQETVFQILRKKKMFNLCSRVLKTAINLCSKSGENEAIPSQLDHQTDTVNDHLSHRTIPNKLFIFKR